MTTLLQFVETTPPGTDKVDLGYIHEFYDRILSPRKDSVSKLLEIGIFNGNSLELWRNYFSNAQIEGADVNQCKRIIGQDRITQQIGNAYTLEFLSRFEKESYDVIIDDGPHTFETMSFFLTHYLSLIKPGGVLILEDIINRDWTPKLLLLVDNTKYKVSTVDMRNKQQNPHLLARWQQGLDIIIIET